MRLATAVVVDVVGEYNGRGVKRLGDFGKRNGWNSSGIISGGSRFRLLGRGGVVGSENWEIFGYKGT